MTLALQFAMAGEAAPFLAKGGFRALPPDPRYGFSFHERILPSGARVIAAVAGNHPRFGVDCIGTVAAALLTHALLDGFAPDRIVSAGTAGGFQAMGGAIGDVYLGAETCVFHDRRIPLGAFEAMGRGHFPIECDRDLAKRLGLKVGIVSTGDSLDCTSEDMARLRALDASVKEMEAASIAWVCERRKTPLVLVKAITDLVDHAQATSDQFLENYGLAVTRLSDVLTHVVDHFTRESHD